MCIAHGRPPPGTLRVVLLFTVLPVGSWTGTAPMDEMNSIPFHSSLTSFHCHGDPRLRRGAEDGGGGGRGGALSIMSPFVYAPNTCF
jgi:hypothetical protein